MSQTIAVKRKLRTGLRLLFREPGRLRKLFGFERYVVFSARTDTIAPISPPAEVTFRHVGEAELETLLELDEEIRDAAHYCGALKDVGAFGAFVNGTFAHLSWLIPPERDSERIRPHLVKLRPGEAGITHCVTLPGFRGRGIYPFVISRLFQLAGDRGIREIFMITRASNFASQHGILKAGLSRRRGRIHCLRILRTFVVFRTFRIRS